MLACIQILGSDVATPGPTRAQALAKLVYALVNYSIFKTQVFLIGRESLKDKLLCAGIWGKESQKCLESLGLLGAQVTL